MNKTNEITTSLDFKISSLVELKEFILWAKTEKIQKLTIGDIALEFNSLAVLPDELPNTEPGGKEIKEGSKTYAEDVDTALDDELLFHSS